MCWSKHISERGKAVTRSFQRSKATDSAGRTPAAGESRGRRWIGRVWGTIVQISLILYKVRTVMVEVCPHEPVTRTPRSDETALKREGVLHVHQVYFLMMW